jgi:hypothetical protein
MLPLYELKDKFTVFSIVVIGVLPRVFDIDCFGRNVCLDINPVSWLLDDY